MVLQKALVCVSVISISLCLFHRLSEASKECLLAFVRRGHKGEADQFDQFQHNLPLNKISHFIYPCTSEILG